MPGTRKPTYLLHKATGQARVRVDGKDYYLGLFGSPESRAKYDDLIAEWLARNSEAANYRLTVEDLALLYLSHAEGFYRKDGEMTSEVSCVRIALRHLVRVHGTCHVRNFGPKKLAEVRKEMIADGVKRKSINLHIGRIRRMFRWGVAEEMFGVAIYQALCTLPGLEEGRSEAVESEPVRPVPQDAIDAVRSYVSEEVWALIQLQLATGARPGEVVIMRGCDLNMSGRVWEYRPRRHKTAHHGKNRVIFVGPRGQAIVRKFLKTDLQAFIFSPKDALVRHRAQLREKRSTPMTPSQARRKPKLNPKKKAGDRYDTSSYRRAIATACEQAFAMPDELRRIDKRLPDDVVRQRNELAAAWRSEHCWHPHQLRHNAATQLRREAGIETTRCALGLSSVAIAEVYAELDLDKAREVIGKFG